MKRVAAALALCLAVVCGSVIAQERGGKQTPPEGVQKERIDFERARELIMKRRRGEKLTADEEAYVRRAMQERQAKGGGGNPRALLNRETTGLVPLTEMSADDKYEGEDGGLYGKGQNRPPKEHQQAAERELAKIEPLNAEGKPAKEGKIVLVSISMSNATQEFSRFKRIADADAGKSPRVTIVDCAQGGQAMAEWVDAAAAPWGEADRRLERSGVSRAQVQAAWIKLANKGPSGSLKEHGTKLQRDTLAVVQNAKARFPNLRVIYFGSRIYGGYTGGPLNPEPYAYESAFAARWLIQDQIEGAPELNYDSKRGEVKAPILLWGPYFWADGTRPRKSDGLVWNRDDFARDGTHPSDSGRDKVARMLLTFFKEDELAKVWFAAR